MNFLISILSGITVIIGMISMLTPIPGGTLMIAGGLTALICTSPSARYCLMWIRHKANWINRLFYWLERKIGGKVKIISTALAKTHPPVGSETRMGHKEFVRRELAQRTNETE